MIGQSQSGTGKTAAFALPVLNRLSKTTPPAGPRKPRALILVPTRELAVQVADSFKKYGRHLLDMTCKYIMFAGNRIDKLKSMESFETFKKYRTIDAGAGYVNRSFR